MSWIFGRVNNGSGQVPYKDAIANISHFGVMASCVIGLEEGGSCFDLIILFLLSGRWKAFVFQINLPKRISKIIETNGRPLRAKLKQLIKILYISPKELKFSSLFYTND